MDFQYHSDLLQEKAKIKGHVTMVTGRGVFDAIVRNGIAQFVVIQDDLISYVQTPVKQSKEA